MYQKSMLLEEHYATAAARMPEYEQNISYWFQFQNERQKKDDEDEGDGDGKDKLGTAGLLKDNTPLEWLIIYLIRNNRPNRAIRLLQKALHAAKTPAGKKKIKSIGHVAMVEMKQLGWGDDMEELQETVMDGGAESGTDMHARPYVMPFDLLTSASVPLSRIKKTVSHASAESSYFSADSYQSFTRPDYYQNLSMRFCADSFSDRLSSNTATNRVLSLPPVDFSQDQISDSFIEIVERLEPVKRYPKVSRAQGKIGLEFARQLLPDEPEFIDELERDFVEIGLETAPEGYHFVPALEVESDQNLYEMIDEDGNEHKKQTSEHTDMRVPVFEEKRVDGYTKRKKSIFNPVSQTLFYSTKTIAKMSEFATQPLYLLDLDMVSFANENDGIFGGLNITFAKSADAGNGSMRLYEGRDKTTAEKSDQDLDELNHNKGPRRDDVGTKLNGGLEALYQALDILQKKMSSSDSISAMEVGNLKKMLYDVLRRAQEERTFDQELIDQFKHSFAGFLEEFDDEENILNILFGKGEKRTRDMAAISPLDVDELKALPPAEFTQKILTMLNDARFSKEFEEWFKRKQHNQNPKPGSFPNLGGGPGGMAA